MNTLYEIIQAAKAAKGSNAKREVLEQSKHHPLLAPFLKAVFDPATSYYITKVPKTSSVGTFEMEESILDGLHYHLANRVLTGKMAERWLHNLYEAQSVESQELLSMIIKRKVGDGVGETMTLDVFPKLFFVPPYNRCGKMDEKAIAEYETLKWFYVDLKHDGQFGYLCKPREGTAKLITRNGSHYPTWLAEKLSEGVLEGFVYMGELLVYDSNGVLLDRKSGNGVLNSVLQGSEDIPQDVDVRIVAWDMVTVDEFEAGLSERPYFERLESLKDVVYGEWGMEPAKHISVTQTQVVYSIKEAYAVNAENITNGHEGSVIKKPNGIWRDSSSGTRDMVKLKVKFTAEYLVTGFYEGEGKAAGMLGGLTVATPCGRLTNNVGSGFTDEERVHLWSIREQLIGKVVSVDANDIVTSKGKDTESLFLPIFVEIRYDRGVADSYERVKEQLAAAKAVEKTTEGDD